MTPRHAGAGVERRVTKRRILCTGVGVAGDTDSIHTFFGTITKGFVVTIRIIYARRVAAYILSLVAKRCIIGAR